VSSDNVRMSLLTLATGFGRASEQVARAPKVERAAADAAPSHRVRAQPTRGSLPPAVLLGGVVNALSVARDLGRMGVQVYAIGSSDSLAKHSRYARWIDVPADDDEESAWATYLLGPDAAHLEGAVLLACSDAGIRVVVAHREALARRFLLDVSDPRAQIEMLDKLTTYQHAAAAGVCTPRFWAVTQRERLMAIRDELVYPLVVKPRLSHVFEARFRKKHIVAETFDDVARGFDAASEANVDVLLVEHVPGGDDHLASYFTYVDANGTPLVDFTKRIIRRYPAGMGAACYHITDRVPELIGPSRELLRQSGLRGLANIEFKRDDRDGKYKLIECNGRFAASNGLVSDAGCNLAALAYSRIVGLPQDLPTTFRSGMRMWDPARDFLAFRERRRNGELSLWQWLRSVAHRQTFPIFRWTDPFPACARLTRMFKR